MNQEKFKCYTMQDLADLHDNHMSEKLNKPVWGKWTYDYDTECLCYNLCGKDDDYHFSLGNIKRSSQILDWIFQLNNKIWMSSQDMKDLIEALDFLLHPQAAYCSFGQDKICEAKTLLPKKPEGYVQIEGEENDDGASDKYSEEP